MKKYYLMYNVGSCKYLVNYHDGVKKHKDNSNFYDVALFKNKVKFHQFINGLIKDGYRERCCMDPL
jgi:hypothetical protein